MKDEREEVVFGVVFVAAILLVGALVSFANPNDHRESPVFPAVPPPKPVHPVYDGVVRGDVNVDGVIDIADLTYLSRELAVQRAMDVDGNGKLNTDDYDSLEVLVFGQ